MALRITQSMMYSGFMSGINRATLGLTESNYQSATQKRVNRPSDDAVSAGRILNTRSTLSTLAIYEENISQAKGWVSLMDSVLGSGTGSVQSVLTRIKELALEGSNGDKTADNRLQISYELREQFKQLINLANSEFSGAHIFGGHKTGQPAYEEGLGVTCMDDGAADALSGALFNAHGSANRTVIIQPVQSGDAYQVNYRYSDDGGATWKPVEGIAVDPPGSPPGADSVCTIQAGGTSFSFNVYKDNNPATPYQVEGVEPMGIIDQGPENPHSNDNGTWIYVRPTAIYQGDDHSNQVVSGYKPSTANAAISGEADGYFTRDVFVRLEGMDAGPPATVRYSYSVDNGSNWVQTSTADPGSDPYRLPVPGGYLTLSGGALNDPADVGSQFVIHPHRAEINYQIGSDNYITVNMVGKDIFGGLYDYPEDGIGYAVPVTSQANLFEVLGDLIAAAETNSQQGMQIGYDALTDVMNVVLTRAAEAGGRSNRLTTTENALLIRTYSEEDLLSGIEDIDPFALSTKLAQQQTTLNSVLKSSSMIMQMSLVNFL
ncbi:flagellar biosynthesis protein FlgL [Desulfovibrio sp. OttesenSCG-928-A18]|nr:flagellar biosynthesis protein FlgL [Desulfovibrio sp. OttesenSCG-928-A18]